MSSDPAPETVARVLSRSAPSASVVRWTVEPDSYPARTPSTESLSRVVAETLDGATLSVFAKTIRSLRHWPMISVLPAAAREAAIARFPWRVEADAYASDLLPGLSDRLRPPVVYEVEDLGDDRIRIWMEDVPAAQVEWNEARYRQAARALGRLAGRSRWDELPVGWPSLFPGPRFIFEGRSAVLDVPAISNEETWRHPLMAAVASADPGLQHDLTDLAERAPAILDALDELPKSLAHGDACPQNLLADPEHADRFVAIDWGFVGLAPIGYDLGQLLVGRVESGDLAVDQLPAIRDAVADGYLAGLRDAGAPGEPAEVLRGFIGGMLLRSGFTAVPLDRLRGPVDDDATAEFARRARYARFLLDQCDVIVG